MVRARDLGAGQPLGQGGADGSAELILLLGGLAVEDRSFVFDELLQKRT